jgi:A/G-specific adenine glycosylase
MPESALLPPIRRWYAESARSLPWRRADVTAWQVLVSEVMLQQTPVSRVLPVYAEWLRRWPTPGALAADSESAAVRLWGRLGYPRRALRLHSAATVIAFQHGGRVPSTYDELRRLPGVGDYTAAAVAAFAYQQRTVVLDTNIRRVLARAIVGVERPPATIRAAERQLAESLLPQDPESAAIWSAALMELGALVCRARVPACLDCPVMDTCAWRASGSPTSPRPGRVQRYAGTDRHCRGQLLAVVRDAAISVSRRDLERTWPEPVQRERALRSLLDDGLVTETTVGEFALARPAAPASARGR